VGIGTASPSGKLNVAGIVKSTALSTVGNDGVWMDFSAPNGRIGAINSSGAPAANLFLATTTTGGTTQTVLQCSYDGTAKVLSTLGVGNTAGSTSGAGITFPATQSASSDANTLDDYEEGTWTPTFNNLGTVSNVTASYIKVGSQCSFWLYFTCTSAPTANSSRFTMPFAAANFGGGTWSRSTNEGGVIEPQASSTQCYFATTASTSTGAFILMGNFKTT
jgi:hypothetical protein